MSKRPPTLEEVEAVYNALTPTQRRALFKVGMAALIDEATGAQETRDPEGLRDKYRKESGADIPNAIVTLAAKCGEKMEATK